MKELLPDRELTVLTTASPAAVVSSKLSATFSAFTAHGPLPWCALGTRTQSTALLYRSSHHCSKIRSEKQIKLQASACAAIFSSNTTDHISCTTDRFFRNSLRGCGANSAHFFRHLNITIQQKVFKFLLHWRCDNVRQQSRKLKGLDCFHPRLQDC